MATTTKTKTKAKAANTGPAGFEFASEMFDVTKAQENFEKAAESFGEMTAFSQDTLEAIVASATAATKGAEEINGQAVSFAKDSFEKGAEMTKAAMTAKSVQEVIEIQTDFTKTIFDAYMAQANKIADVMTQTTAQASEPINGRFNAFVEAVQSAR